MKKYTKGFTLIELLVVIAIIGILSAIVLASLNSARAKGQDASIKGNLSGARAQAELYYNDNTNSYSGVCSTTLSNGTKPIYSQFVSAANVSGQNSSSTIITAAATAGTAGQATCHDSGTAWAAEVPLKTTTGSFYCVDSSGAAVVTTASTLGASDYACN